LTSEALAKEAFLCRSTFLPGQRRQKRECKNRKIFV